MPTLTYTREELIRAITSAWGPGTSNDAEAWTPANPALGQCAVTALVVQDFLRGRILRTVVGGVSHYWNELPSGEELDLTRCQFASYEATGRDYRTREYVVSFPETRERYQRLRAAVVEQLERA